MITRRRQALVEDRLRSAPCVVLLGPRQVGKTTLARRIAAALPRLEQSLAARQAYAIAGRSWSCRIE